VETLSLWFNNVPAKETVTCHLSPIRALPALPSSLRNPSVTVGGKRITFPVNVETGQFLEFLGPDDCTLYGPKGEALREVKPEGDAPVLEPGANQVEFACEPLEGVNPRAYVSVITEGEPFGGANPPDQIRSEFLPPKEFSQGP
ncbi:MAG: hypothetical protein ABIP48_30265, partial [Planctomycetota bacterium]